jgi:hypothetical protein
LVFVKPLSQKSINVLFLFVEKRPPLLPGLHIDDRTGLQRLAHGDPHQCI